MAMTYQMIVCGVALSLDAAEWGLIVVGLTQGGPSGRAIVLADQSGRMSSGEAAGRLAALGATGKVSAAPVAKDAAERLQSVTTLAARDGARPPPAWPMTIGDGSGLWTEALQQVHEAGRLAFNLGLEALEEAVGRYRPGDDSPRVGALLAAVSYLRDIGGLVGVGSSWEQPVRSPVVAGAVTVGQHRVSGLALAERLGAKTEGWG